MTPISKVQSQILSTLIAAGGAYVFVNVGDERHARPFRALFKAGRISYSWSGCTMCARLVESKYEIVRRNDGTNLVQGFSYPSSNTIYERRRVEVGS